MFVSSYYFETISEAIRFFKAAGFNCESQSVDTATWKGKNREANEIVFIEVLSGFETSANVYAI